MWQSASRVAILLMSLLIPSLANAQYGRDTFAVGLTAEDIALAQATARERMDDQPVGTVLEWENPATRAAGSVELIRLYEREGMACREVMHIVHSETEGRNEFLSRICLAPDGTWKFDE
ncbi:MAG: RT0821/Lpp0805 family surface protein [Alphaproteobacteria bacterium]